MFALSFESDMYVQVGEESRFEITQYIDDLLKYYSHS